MVRFQDLRSLPDYLADHHVSLASIENTLSIDPAHHSFSALLDHISPPYQVPLTDLFLVADLRYKGFDLDSLFTDQPTVKIYDPLSRSCRSLESEMNIYLCKLYGRPAGVLRFLFTFPRWLADQNMIGTTFQVMLRGESLSLFGIPTLEGATSPSAPSEPHRSPWRK